MILRYAIEIKQSNKDGHFEATVDEPGKRVAVFAGPDLFEILRQANEAVVEAEAVRAISERGLPSDERTAE